MKNKIYWPLLLFTIVLLKSQSINAQLDSIHWLPPLYARNNPVDSYLYLSTPSPVPFTVNIKNGAGTILASPVISQGAPFRYYVGAGIANEMFIDVAQLNNVQTTKGLILEGPEKFYANFRTQNSAQAGSITAKGRGGAGTDFRIGFMPVMVDNSSRNNFFSFMATENNTSITVSGYNPAIVFNGTPTLSTPTINVTLNAGESYVVSCIPNSLANQTGLIGASINADKPIIVNEGNILGTITLGASDGQDMGIDQSIPVAQLGTEYISIKGNGLDAQEQVLVIADQNNTTVTVNGVLLNTLNAGGWMLVDNTNYIGVGHQHMYIQTSSPVYALQFLAGSASTATPGMNILAPISCFLPNTIDLIPDVDRVGDTVYAGAVFIVTKAGSTVTANGVPQVGAEPVAGSIWETYKLPGLTGNLVLQSNNRMIGGMFGYSGAAGFASFFSGFDKAINEIVSIPNPVTADSCGAVVLTVPNYYDTYNWFFEGNPYPGDSSVNYATQSGNYYVTMTDYLGCVDTAINNNVVVYNNPVVSFTAQDTCYGLPNSFNGSFSIPGTEFVNAWDWDFGDGNTSTLEDPTNIYAAPGVYNVILIGTTNNSCSDTAQLTTTVYEEPVASFAIMDTCEYLPSSFTDESSIAGSQTVVGWNWDFGDGQTDTVQHPTHLFPNEGSYVVTLTVTSSLGCIDDTSMSAIIDPKPNAFFSYTPACEYDSIAIVDNSTVASPDSITNWFWDFGDGSGSSTMQNNNYLYATSGTYVTTLYLTTNNNCLDTIQLPVTVYPVPNLSFTNTSVCVNEPPTVFTNTSTVGLGTITSYYWDFGDGNTSMIENPSNNYSSSGNYNVTLAGITNFGCVDTITNTIMVLHKPVANFTQDTTGGCIPICVQFTDLSTDSAAIANWNWKFESSPGESFVGNSTYCYENDGIYTVELIVQNSVGCYDTIVKQDLIEIWPLPTSSFDFSPEQTYVTAATFTFDNTSFDALTSSWNFGDSISRSNDINPIHNYADTGTYVVELIVENSYGCKDTSYEELTVLPVEDLFVPSAFSPNGDGENDVLYARGYIGNMLFIVYDRWGMKVFESTDKEIGWDGTVNGQNALEGVYMWYLDAEINNKSFKLKGDITLIR